jgi:SAM-dependent methyltransferase
VTIDEFFELFLGELQGHKELNKYYGFLHDKQTFAFRRNYFVNRLDYVQRHIGAPSGTVWDCGCGYGTTALFLTLNGHKVVGTTLEHYSDQIPRRLEYWSKHGDISGFSYNHANIFDPESQPKQQFERIIVQDTLHHLEPVDDALALMRRCLSPTGRIVVVEENGANLLLRGKLFIERRNNRIIEVWDEKLGRTFLLGNENIRRYEEWRSLFARQGLNVSDPEYVRYYLPFAYWLVPSHYLATREASLWRSSRWRRDFFYFGVNFVAQT